MKTYITTLLIIPAFFFIFTNIAEAAIIDDAITNLRNIGDRSEIGIAVDTDPSLGIATVVGGIIEVVLSVLGVVFLALAVYGGWLWMTAAGNQERVSKAKDLLRDAVIGIAVVFTAFAITRFVVDNIIKASAVAPTPGS